MSRVAHEAIRDEEAGGLRLDAVFFCMDGLKKIRELGDMKAREVVYEIAVLGRSGLDIHDPATNYTLSSLPG